MTTGFDVYRRYVSLKAHFKTGSFDYTTHGDLHNTKRETFLKRKDRYFFDKLAHKYTTDELTNIFVANFVVDPDIWIGDFFGDKAEEIYVSWRRRTESLEYSFKQDMGKLREFLEKNNRKFNDIFVCSTGTHPDILKLLLQNAISTETFLILDSLLGFIARFDVDLREDFMWKSLQKKYKKYGVFLKLSERTNIFKKIALKELSMLTTA